MKFDKWHDTNGVENVTMFTAIYTWTNENKGKDFFEMEIWWICYGILSAA